MLYDMIMTNMLLRILVELYMLSSVSLHLPIFVLIPRKGLPV